MRDRGVSTVLSYVLALGILSILVSGLVVSFAPFVTNQQQDTAQSTMQVFGNDLAGDLDTVDRLATRNGTNRTVEYRTRLPERVSGSRYEIEVVDTSGQPYTYEIWLRAVDFEASTIVRVRTQTPVADGSLEDPLDGGDLLVTYDADADRLVIRDE